MIFNLLSFEYWFYFLYTIAAVLVAVYIPGAIALKLTKVKLSLLGTTVLPLVMGLYMDGRVRVEGRRIGVFRLTKEDILSFEQSPLYGYYGGEQLYDLSASPSSKLLELGWKNANPETVYNATQNWFKENDK